MTNANNEVLGFAYNPANEILALTDGKNQTTLWNYDAYGRVTNKVDAAANVLFVYQYDPNDRLTNRWSAAKGNTVYKYDPIGDLTNVAYPVSSSLAFRYDGLNRLTNMVDGVGATAFAWTPGNQLASAGGLWPDDTVSYGYNNRLPGTLNVLAPNADAWTQSYGYDSLARLTNVASPAGNFAYAYQSAAGDLVQTLQFGQSGVGPYIQNQFDGLARLYDTKLYTPSIIANEHSYSYDAGNERTQQVFTAGNLINYTYDKIGQLKTALGFEPMGTPATNRLQEHFGYGYDKAWNLNYRTNNALVDTFNVNSLNELTTETNHGTLTVAGTATERKANYVGDSGVTSVTVSGTGLSSGAANLYVDGSWARPGAAPANGQNTYTATAQDYSGRQDTNSVTVSLPGTNTFSYDLNGNLLSDGTRNFAYDDENQLISVWVTNAWQSTFAYDGMMRRRIRKEYTWTGGAWVKTNEVHYVYDRKLVIQERDANNLPITIYSRGNDLSGTFQGAGGIGGLLARTDYGQLMAGLASAHSYYHCDANGNITALLSTNGNTVARYTYDPFGNVLTMSGPLAAANLYRFSSKEWHLESGLIYYGFRYYDTSLQRWISRDPLADPAHLILRQRSRLVGWQRASPGLGLMLYAVNWRESGVRRHLDYLEFDQAAPGVNLYFFAGNDTIILIDPWGLKCFLDRAGQFFGGVGAFAGGMALALVSEGPQALLTVPSAVIAMSYGVGNVVAAFAPDSSDAEAEAMQKSPSSLGGAVGRAIGGPSGQAVGDGAQAIMGLPGAINEGNFLEAAESGVGALNAGLDASEAATKGSGEGDGGCDDN